MKFAPIALFIYKRPEHTRRTIEALMQCPEFSESQLFVFCDGAQRSQDQEVVEKTRTVVRSLVGNRAEITESPSNQGLANSIIAGVTRLVHEFEEVIVLEDDLVVSPGFLNYMNQGLNKYRYEDQVMQISGYMFPVPEFQGRNKAIFLPITVSWGWATWKRAWRHFDPEATGWEILKHDPQMRKRFNFEGAYNYFSIIEHQFRGECDSWAIRWYWSVFSLNGLVLFPPQTMVKNLGFDGSGTHGSRTQFYSSDFLHLVNDFCWPQKAAVSEADFIFVQDAIRSAKFFDLLSVKKIWQGILKLRKMMNAGIGRLGFSLVSAAKHFLLYLQEAHFRNQALVHQTSKFMWGAQIYNIKGERNAIKIGSNTIIAGHLLTFKHGGKIQIGEWCYIGENSRIWSANKIRIGSRVLISHGVNVHDTDSHSLDAYERHQHFVSIATVGHPESVPNISSAPVLVEDDVWIGCNATILKGVRIGRASIIAAGSVVTKNVPEKVLIAGNPARVIRELD